LVIPMTSLWHHSGITLRFVKCILTIQDRGYIFLVRHPVNDPYTNEIMNNPYTNDIVNDPYTNEMIRIPMK
jgi:hypothetical protein